MNKSKLNYRAEVDGLRAIAIISVILYHAQIFLLGRNWLEGGFIGVDVFFVISGYLITRIILSELYEHNSICFANFYERRARRLFPMLFFVIFVTIPFAWKILLPSDFVEYIESVLSSLFFSSNFFFYFSTTQYGADSSLLKPFLHTWTLGVEEQFYLMFPVIAILTFKFFNKYFLSILIALSLLSLQFAESMEVRNADLNFYLPFSRFWELAIGSILAYRELNYQKVRNQFLEQVLPIVGIYLVVHSILFFDENTRHPSFQTIVPILGTALIIAFSSKNEIVGKVLGSRPFVWIGLISYSLYLWHFPIFSLSRYINSNPTNYDKLCWIILTFILSVVSYFIIEKPFRSKTIPTKKLVWFSGLSIITLSAFSVFSIQFFDYKKVEQSSLVSYKSILDKNAFLEVWRDQADKEIADTNFTSNSNRKVLIIGNSHSVDFFRALNSANIYKDVDFGSISQNRSSDNYQVYCFYEFITKGSKKCGSRGATFNDIESKLELADLIIFKTRWKTADLVIIEKLIAILSEVYNKEILIVGNGFEQNNAIELRKFIKEHHSLPNDEQNKHLEKQVFLTAQHEKVDKIDGKLIEIANRLSVPFLPSRDLFCNYESKECSIFTDDGYLILWDYGHYTVNGAKYVGRILSNKHWGREYIKPYSK